MMNELPRPWWQNWDQSFTGDIFGNVYGGNSVQEAFYNTLQKWLPTYIAEFNRQLGGEVLKDNVEYRHRPEYRTLPKDVVCAILVIVPGTSEAPQTFQESIRANWDVHVQAFVYGTKDWQETQALTNAYAACIRACIIQQKDLGNFAETTKWINEKYYEGEHSATRTTGMGQIDFQVTVGNATTPYGGPPTPPYAPAGASTGPSLLPPSDPVIATSKNVTIEKEQT
jgi:hypothetical protein